MARNHSGLGPLTVDEFLAFENASSSRHEYVAGRVYAMAGTTARHNRIVQNLGRRLDDACRGGPCESYLIDLKVRASRDRIYYPDAVVVCTPHSDNTLVFNDPCLVVEVTSRTTRRTDRGEKLDAYLAMASLRGYLVVEHDRRHVTLYSRGQGDEWAREEAVTSGQVNLPCPRAILSLADVYDGVDMPPLRVREARDFEEDDVWVGLLGPLVPR